MTRAYAGLDDGFAVRLENAAPDLFTFIRHPGMEPTNNESERMLRKVAIRRKIRQKIGDCRRKDHVRHHNDVPACVGQTRTELVQKTVRSVLGDLTYYLHIIIYTYMYLCFIMLRHKKSRFSVIFAER